MRSYCNWHWFNEYLVILIFKLIPFVCGIVLGWGVSLVCLFLLIYVRFFTLVFRNFMFSLNYLGLSIDLSGSCVGIWSVFPEISSIYDYLMFIGLLPMLFILASIFLFFFPLISSLFMVYSILSALYVFYVSLVSHLLDVTILVCYLSYIVSFL